jgi:hypothetical protein
MNVSNIQSSLLLAAFFRGMRGDEPRWYANCDQVVTLSLFYTGDLSFNECQQRFEYRSYVGGLYDDEGDLKPELMSRYIELIALVKLHPELIEGGGNLELPTYPTYTSCRLTPEGVALAITLAPMFPLKPEFPNWPDNRDLPKAAI